MQLPSSIEAHTVIFLILLSSSIDSFLEKKSICMSNFNLVDESITLLSSNERVCQVKNSTMTFLNCQKMFLIELITSCHTKPIFGHEGFKMIRRKFFRKKENTNWVLSSDSRYRNLKKKSLSNVLFGASVVTSALWVIRSANVVWTEK